MTRVLVNDVFRAAGGRGAYPYVKLYEAPPAAAEPTRMRSAGAAAGRPRAMH